MADLIQIGIDVNTNIKQATADLDKMGGSVVNNIRTIDRLESEVKQLNNALSKGSATEAAYAKGMRQINNELSVFQQRAAKAAQIERKFGSAAASGGKSMNRFNVALQQGGFQLQDFAVQLQSGTSFFTAFGQQGSQFAGIFGPQGAVIGAVIAIGSAIGGIAAKSFMASRSVKDFGEQLEETSSVMKDYISLASESDEVFASLFKSSKTALSQTSQAAKDLLLIAKTEALDSIRGLGKALSDTSTEAGFWAKVMLNTDRTVTGNLLNIDTQLKGNITTWKNTGKEVQAFIDEVRNIGKADSIDGMYQSALKARDIFKQTVDVTGEMTEDQKSFWKELSTTIMNLETMGATVEAMNGSWSDTSEAVDAATASMKLFYEYAERDAEEQDKRTAAVNKIKDALAATLLIESRRVEIAQAGANLDEVLAKQAREDFILNKKKEGIIGNNLVIALKAYDNAVASLKAEEDRNATLDQRGEAERALARDNAAYAKAAAAADAKAKTEAQKLLELQIRISATPAYEPMSAFAIEAEKSQAEMIKIFQTSAALKEELGESAFEALRLGGVDLSNVDDASKSAALLAARLGYSYEEALKLREISADPLNAFGGAGPFIPNYVEDDDKKKKELKDINDVIAALREQTNQETKLLGLTGERRTEEEIFYQLVQENAKADIKASKDKLRAIAKEIAAQKKANEAFSKLVEITDELSDAFGDYVASGLKDFKGFTDSIKSMFKKLLSDMAAMAIRNRILIPIATGMGAGMGMSTAANAMGQYATGGAQAGTIGATLATGASTIGTGLSTGFMTTMYGGGTGAISGGLSVGGLSGFSTAIGAAIPYLIAAAVVIGLFTKKTKLLDSGLRTTVEGFDVAIETFKKTQTSRLFGLLKGSKKTAYEAASAEVADPLIEAIGDMQQSIVDAAGTLGIGANAFDNFSYQFKLSLKGLTEEEQLQKINEEITKMGDSFASLTGHFETMNELLEAANQRMQLQNRLDQLLGNNQAILTRQREAELKAMHELNRPLAEAIYTLEDAKAAESVAQAAVQAAFTALRNSIDQEKSKIQKSFASLLSGLTDRLDVANEALNKSKNVYETLSSALSSRTIGTQSSSDSRASALRFIKAGDFSDESKLKDALSIVAEPSEALFSSFEDYARDFAQNTAAIKEATRASSIQLSNDEKQILLLEKQIEKSEQDLVTELEALDEQYQIQLDQYNTLMGIDTSVKGVTEAIGTLRSAIESLASAQAASAAASAAASSALSAGAGPSSSAGLEMTGEKYQGFDLAKLKGAADLMAAAAQNNLQTSGKTGAQIQQELSNATGLAINMDNDTRAKQFAMGGYHTGGLRIVGERGPELEATGPSRIYTASQTKDMFSGSKDDSELRREVSELRIDLKAALVQIAKNTRKSSDTLNKFDYQGLPESRGY